MPDCRSCGAPLTQTFVDLGEQPLSNAYLNDPGDPDPRFPLIARVCSECLLVQADEVCTPDRIFTDYAFLSGASTPWVQHCQTYMRDMMRRFKPTSVLEIASNDGTLLAQFPEQVRVQGVDPAANIEPLVPTAHEFFTEDLAGTLEPAELVVANNVLGHVPDINDFVAGLARVLAPGGVLTIEVPWLWRLIEGCQYDTIYHEHFSYWSIAALDPVLERHGLYAFDLAHLPVHGGSIRVMVSNMRQKPSPVLQAARHTEQCFGVTNLNSPVYTQFAARVERLSGRVRAFFEHARDAEQLVVGAGAPAKGNTLLNTAKVDVGLLPATTDTTPFKQGKYLPGSKVPILPPDMLDDLKPEFVFVLAWNWYDAIERSFAWTRGYGARFVKPIPWMVVD